MQHPLSSIILLLPTAYVITIHEKSFKTQSLAAASMKTLLLNTPPLSRSWETFLAHAR